MAQINSFSTNLGLTATPETSNPEFSIELQKVYNAITNLALALDAYTGAQSPSQDLWSSIAPVSYFLAGNTHKLFLQAGETITYGQPVTIKSDGKAWLASSSASLKCRGFMSSGGSVSAGGYLEVQTEGIVVTSGLTAGATYWISATAGNYSGAATTQAVAFAISATYLYVNPALI